MFLKVSLGFLDNSIESLNISMCLDTNNSDICMLFNAKHYL